MLNDGKFAGDGDGRGSQLGDWAGGENPINEADGFSAEPLNRKWLMEVEFTSCEFVKEYVGSL